MTRTRILLPAFAPLMAAAIALALPASVAAQSANDFQLQPDPTPTPSGPVIQGPVDEGAPVRPAPTPAQTATPTPAPAPRPVATRTPSPTASPVVQPVRQPTPTARPTVRTTTAPTRQIRQTPSPRPLPPTGETEVVAPSNLPPTLPPAPTNTSAATNAELPGFPVDQPASETTDGAEAATGPEFLWPWLVALAALLAALAGLVLWRKRGPATPATIAPPITRPTATPDAKTATTAGAVNEPDAAEPVPVAASRAWLTVDARALQLRRSMMNANLTYRLTVANRSGAALENVIVEVDLATAHGKAPVEEQLATPDAAMTERHVIERLAPGERLALKGEAQIPLSEVKIIQQGQALLCVPLLRLRAVLDGRDSLARTWVVGRKNPQAQGRLQPFRFDAPPQTYSDIAERALD